MFTENPSGRAPVTVVIPSRFGPRSERTARLPRITSHLSASPLTFSIRKRELLLNMVPPLRLDRQVNRPCARTLCGRVLVGLRLGPETSPA